MENSNIKIRKWWNVKGKTTQNIIFCCCCNMYNLQYCFICYSHDFIIFLFSMVFFFILFYFILKSVSRISTLTEYPTVILLNNPSIDRYADCLSLVWLIPIIATSCDWFKCSALIIPCKLCKQYHQILVEIILFLFVALSNYLVCAYVCV